MAASEKTSKLPGASVSLAVVAILWLMYVLSPGPVLFLLMRFESPFADKIHVAAQVVYAPLGWIYEHWEPAHLFYDTYFEFLGVNH